MRSFIHALTPRVEIVAVLKMLAANGVAIARQGEVFGLLVVVAAYQAAVVFLR